ncbi:MULTISPECIES: DUF4143 domain-containing protein [unclassified Synechococcus]|uniref:DUF4143 domain-containing protein n=1 Tax=unclassified Synechococcus TaxID=2626047 RepID=UPI0020CD3646|nr:MULTISPECIES: DUF4143 domain-containing protein [unclassified Synechococcus]
MQAEALVRDLGYFARFLEAISFSHGSTINLSAVARECQVGRKTVESYLGILGDLLLVFRVPVFCRRAKRQLVAHEKFFYVDTGAFRSPKPAGLLDAPAEIEGMALEGLVAQHLRGWIAYRDSDDPLFLAHQGGPGGGFRGAWLRHLRSPGGEAQSPGAPRRSEGLPVRLSESHGGRAASGPGTPADRWDSLPSLRRLFAGVSIRKPRCRSVDQDDAGFAGDAVAGHRVGGVGIPQGDAIVHRLSCHLKE